MQTYETIQAFLAEIIADSDNFIVAQYCLPGNAYQFFIDADTSFDLTKAVSATRRLRKKIEDAGLHPDGDYTLEISSPGIDIPLVMTRQYLKNIGRLLEVETTNEAEKPVIGRLTKADDQQIQLEITDKKKKTTTEQIFSYQQIKQSTVQIEF